MKVVEIFDSMQGEGFYMGVYCTFVRFAGCNLQCPFCDEHEKYSQAKEMTIPQIVKKCKQFAVVLTGGEPTIQKDLWRLVEKLKAAGHSVRIETNGTSTVTPAINWVTCSPKAPKYQITPGADEIKLVVSKDLSLKKALEIANEFKNRVWLQPCDGPWLEQSKKRITKWIRRFPDQFRAGIQLHKYYNER